MLTSGILQSTLNDPKPLLFLSIRQVLSVWHFGEKLPQLPWHYPATDIHVLVSSGKRSSRTSMSLGLFFYVTVWDKKSAMEIKFTQTLEVQITITNIVGSENIKRYILYFLDSDNI